jgi:hypothetical protein
VRRRAAVARPKEIDEMNLLLWILQIVLALLCLSGGAFKMSKPGLLALPFRALSSSGWRMIGALELLCGILLIVPAAFSWRPILTLVGAVALAVESLLLSAVYASVSRKMTAANPLVWSLAMAAIAAFVAYGRYALVPLA